MRNGRTLLSAVTTLCPVVTDEMPVDTLVIVCASTDLASRNEPATLTTNVVNCVCLIIDSPPVCDYFAVAVAACSINLATTLGWEMNAT
jgi:hypothetical protein